MADEQEQDVQDGTSPSAPEPTQAAAGAVTASGAEPEDKDPQGVPWKNRMAEMERKHEKALDEMRAMFQQAVTQLQPQPQYQAPKPAQQQYTDEELLALGNQGHAVAMQEYIQRQIAKQSQVQQRASLADQHVAALRNLYPDFNNSASPLYQAANTLYRQYLNAGYPATAETQHTAMSTAAAAFARQQAQQQTAGQVSEATRQQQVNAHDAIGGTSVAPAGSNRRRPSGPTPEQVELGKKIGVKDPAKALANFRKRNEEGRNSFGPGLSSAAERVLP